MIVLDREQEELLILLVEAFRNVPRDRRQEFYMMHPEHMYDGILVHPGLSGGKVQARPMDVDILARSGMVHISSRDEHQHPQSFEPTPEGNKYYSNVKQKQGEPLARTEEAVRQHLLDPGFQARYPSAYGKWSEAERLLGATSTQEQLTTVGHLCREAMQMFAEQLHLKHVGPSGEDLAKTKNRIRAVVVQLRPRVGAKIAALLDALVHYWEAVNGVVQRQEHGLSKDSSLVLDDGRRVVLHTAVVMLELDRTTGTSR